MGFVVGMWDLWKVEFAVGMWDLWETCDNHRTSRCTV